MLSRLAERVYWIGRLVERADDLARIVATYDRSQAQLGAADPGSLRVLTQALGADLRDPREPAEIIGGWMVDRSNRSSVVACLSRARENALGAREVLSLELWENLHAADAWLTARIDAAAAPADLARGLPVHTRAFFGLLDSVTVRDETWSVLRAGALVERASMTARILLLGRGLEERIDADDPLHAHAWGATLRACAALDAFRRGQAATPAADEVEALLLRDQTCPRSVRACCVEAAALLDDNPGIARMLRSIAGEVAESRLGARAVLDALDVTHHALIASWRGA
jgi:uncharacterized alpha-E superfamily protein